MVVSTQTLLINDLEVGSPFFTESKITAASSMIESVLFWFFGTKISHSFQKPSLGLDIAGLSTIFLGFHQPNKSNSNSRTSHHLRLYLSDDII